ncbi:serine hydrolase [Flagellimonas sp.]
MISKSVSILSSLIVFFEAVLGYGQIEPRLQGIDAELNKILSISKAPGLAVAIVEGDKIIYAKGFGYRDYDNKFPMNANTVMPVGSTTKAFTCALLGRLRDEGKLAFTDSPIKHISQLRFYRHELNTNITIKDLMTHQTGIPRHDESWYLFPSHDKDSLVQRVQYQEPYTGLRQEFHYNNFMLMLQGVISERITGSSWEANINNYFLKPLDMKRSNTSISELKNSTNRAIGYELQHDTLIQKVDYFDLAGIGPAGSINSSAKEMANWLKVWLNKGVYQGKQILSESYVIEAMSSQVVTSASLPEKESPDMHLSNYGYGWFISSYRGHYRVQHEGNIDGFSANVSFFPSDSLGIVVLTNQGASSVTSMVRNSIADRMLKIEPTDWVQDFLLEKEKNEKERNKIKEIATVNKKDNFEHSNKPISYTGSYQNKGYGTFKIFEEKDSLFAQFKLKKYYLKQSDTAVFTPFELAGLKLEDSGLPVFHFQHKSERKKQVLSLKIRLEESLQQPITFKKL